ncbi:MAG: hypothetical protein K8R23_19360 [Chthoniobacter sp.]|nr:hypothetical protein [Chthoniobacter sp.]
MFTIVQLKRATAIAEQIEKLQADLAAVLGSPAKVSTSSVVATVAKSRGGKRFVSPEARAKMAAAQKARWAKKAGSTAPKAPAKAKSGITAEGRARLAAAMKARWDARKKGAPAPTAPSKESAAKPAKKAKKGKRVISPEARAKMAEAAKRRWAKAKKS